MKIFEALKFLDENISCYYQPHPCELKLYAVLSFGSRLILFCIRKSPSC